MISTKRRRHVTFAVFAQGVAESYREQGAPYHTRQPVKRVLKILDDMGVETTAELERQDVVDRFHAYCVDHGFKPTTRDTWLARLRTIVRRGKKLGYLRFAPEFPILEDPRKLPRSLRSDPPTTAEVRRLLDHLRIGATSWEAWRLYALVSVVTLAGVQLKSALAMRPDDVDLADGAILIPIQRSQRLRRVRISAELYEALAAWLPRVVGRFLFPNVSESGRWHLSGRIAGKGPHPYLHVACEAAGVRHITFEQLRRFHSEQSTTTVRLSPDPIGGACTVAISDDRHLVVKGVDQGELSSQERFELVHSLIKAGPAGIPSAQMEHHTGQSGWWQTLNKIRKRFPSFDDVLAMPGRRGGGNVRLLWAPT